MTAIDDLDLSLSGSSDGGTTRKKKRPKGGQGRKRMAENWPRDEMESYCHQCRNKTFIMKIACGECSKKYCARCLTTRYGERPESYDALADFVCPFCEGSCTCDICTRKRGGIYNRIKSAGKQNWSRAPQTSPERQPQPDKIPPKPVTISGPVTYWAVMYDLTGQKIGTAFVGGDGKEDVVVVKRPSSVPRRRIFVGAVQPSWGLGESPIVKDLDPVVPRNPESGGKRLREYVGNRAVLHLPVVPSVQVDAANVENHNIIEGVGTIETGGISEDPGANTSEIPVVATSDVDDTDVDKSFASPLSSLSSLDASGDEGGEEWT
ncbi:hypothetical protein BDZ94DRAFT_1270318 [Collybia nuda]|uniref:Zinc-finger domain-containing protein n=1 Tax=Collybia nuda TaxID=64659 RepID=A0A9P5XXI9_9AGAR|nr:hypothetical protein BDZ94DRAFT_1270318 [Collybia nuda]